MKYGGSNTQYCTPAVLLAPVTEWADMRGGLSLDPCSHPDSDVRARTHIMPPEQIAKAHEEQPGWLTAFLRRCGGVLIPGDGLVTTWVRTGPVFVNPPFRDVTPWFERAIEQSGNGAEAVILTNNDTSTEWYQDVVHPNVDAVCLFRGRKKFKGAKSSNPFPHLFSYFGYDPESFREVFRQYGRCW